MGESSVPEVPSTEDRYRHWEGGLEPQMWAVDNSRVWRAHALVTVLWLWVTETTVPTTIYKAAGRHGDGVYPEAAPRTYYQEAVSLAENRTWTFVLHDLGFLLPRGILLTPPRAPRSHTPA